MKLQIAQKCEPPGHSMPALGRVAWAVAAIAMFASVPVSGRPLQDLVWRSYQPVQIAVPEFLAGSSADTEITHAISDIIVDDLKQTGVFASIDLAGSINNKVSIDGLPQFADWQAIKTQELLVGRVTRQPDNRIKVEFRLWDVFGKSQMLGQQYFGSPENFERIGHTISAEIYVHVMNKRTFR